MDGLVDVHRYLRKGFFSISEICSKTGSNHLAASVPKMWTRGVAQTPSIKIGLLA